MADLQLALTIRDLRHDDLPGPWAAYPGHVEAVRRTLDLVPSGTRDYVTASLPSGRLVGKCGINYEEVPGAGVLTQLDVAEVLQSCGIGSALIAECERRIQARGVRRVELAAETNNPRAQALYERLGYVVYDEKPGGWDHTNDDGTVAWYATTLVHLYKELPES